VQFSSLRRDQKEKGVRNKHRHNSNLKKEEGKRVLEKKKKNVRLFGIGKRIVPASDIRKKKKGEIQWMLQYFPGRKGGNG